MQLKTPFITLVTLFLSVIFALFSTAVISYVAMATPIGPWMEMTLVLLGTIFFRFLTHQIAVTAQMRSLACATAAGGIGGAVAMACAFSFPTLYFLDPELFNTWMAKPFYFSAIMAGLVLAAGSFGFLIARHWQEKFLSDESMVFPIGQMVYNMIAIQNQFARAVQLACGAAAALIYSLLQNFTLLIPARLTLLPAINGTVFTIGHVAARTDILPMFWAIGFTTGHVIAMPLLIAVIAKLALVDPIHNLFFSHLTTIDYILAFGAGMAIQGALLSLADAPKTFGKIYNFVWFDSLRCAQHSPRTGKKRFALISQLCLKVKTLACLPAVALAKAGSKGRFLLLLPAIIFLTYFSFTIPEQLYLLAFTIICAYQLLIIAGKLGIAPLGRFATFVMIPGLLIFGFTALQITFLAAFVEISCIVAVDSMFGQKVAQLASINHSRMMQYQWIGLLVSAISIGAIFWLLISHFELGSAELIASRAQGRAVLIQAFKFDYMVMLLGFLFSYSLKFLHVNPTLVFGGLLMGLDSSLMLIAGGLSTYLVKNKEDHYPFWSGVYAANSLWIFLRMLF